MSCSAKDQSSSTTGNLKSKAHLDAIAEVLADPITMIDANNVIVWANEAAKSLYGSEIVGMKCFEVFHEGEEPCSPCPVGRCFVDGRVHHAERRINLVRGRQSVLCTIASVAARDAHGRPALVVEFSRDVTEERERDAALRESEERFRAVFQTVTDCVFIKGADLKLTHVNPAMEKLMEQPARALLGLTEQELFQDSPLDPRTDDLDARVLCGETVRAKRSRKVRGTPMLFQETRVPLRDSKGRIAGICVSARRLRDSTPGRREPRHSVGSSQGSRSMQGILAQARMAAATDSFILLTGETGTGKDFIAKYIHDHSSRADGPFFSVNCAAVAREVAESELFGYERGAFTGAGKRKHGLLELAEGGTLLLNEIGELDPGLQAKLLTFLDTKTFTRVGGERRISVNARLLAATNRDLSADVNAGRFRADLFFRINVLTIEIPPLRERMEDLPFLVDKLMRELAEELGLDEVPTLHPRTLDRLAGHNWPGNVRELRNILERALILSEGTDVDRAVMASVPSRTPWRFAVEFPDGRSLREVIDEVERAVISEALRRCGGRKRTAARLLGMSREKLYRRMRDNL